MALSSSGLTGADVRSGDIENVARDSLTCFEDVDNSFPIGSPCQGLEHDRLMTRFDSNHPHWPRGPLNSAVDAYRRRGDEAP